MFQVHEVMFSYMLSTPRSCISNDHDITSLKLQAVSFTSISPSLFEKYNCRILHIFIYMAVSVT